MSLLPVPAIIVPLPRVSSRVAWNSAMRSTSLSVDASPVVPATTMPSDPAASRLRTNAR